MKSKIFVAGEENETYQTSSIWKHESYVTDKRQNQSYSMVSESQKSAARRLNPFICPSQNNGSKPEDNKSCMLSENQIFKTTLDPKNTEKQQWNKQIIESAKKNCIILSIPPKVQTKTNSNSNIIKNFMLAFSKDFTAQKNLQKLKKDERYSFLIMNKDPNRILKNIKDNLLKKVSYGKRNLKLNHIRSMLKHKNSDTQTMLIRECFKFTIGYEEFLESTRVKDKDSNLQVIKKVHFLMNQIDKQLFEKLKKEQLFEKLKKGE